MASRFVRRVSRAAGTSVGGNQNQTYHAATINFNFVAMASAHSVADLPVHHVLQAVAGPSNRASSDATHPPHQLLKQQAIAAADDASGLIVSIVGLLMNHTESLGSYRDLKLSLEQLDRTIVISRLALQILEPCGCNLARAIIDCHVALQELFRK